MREDAMVWSKSQMFEAIKAYQTGLGEVQQHLDVLAQAAEKNGLTPKMRMFIDQVSATIVATTVDAARALGN